MLTVALMLIAGGTISAQSGQGYEEALACVLEQLPAEVYSTNEFIPTEEELASIEPLKETVHIRVGMPWILNDEEAPFYNAVELGFYAEEGLVVELVPGGPGRDHMQSLGAGAVDITVQAAGSSIPIARISPTPINTVAVGTLLKIGQYTYLTTNPDLLGRGLTPADLVGSTISTQQGGGVYTQILMDQLGLDFSSVTIEDTAGFGPDVLMTDPPQADFYTGWIANQPRALEAAGLPWNYIRYGEWGPNEYTDVIAVSDEMLGTEEGREIVRRFMRATYRGLQYLVDNPEESAEIASEYGVEAELTVEQALWRFNIQEEQNMITGTDGMPLMYMDPEVWNSYMAVLLQYEQIEMDCE